MTSPAQSADDWRLATVTTPEFEALAESVDPPVKRALRRALPASIRYRVASWLLDAPVTSRMVRRLDPKLRRIGRVDHKTGLVIEGFPRSANSYARVAFQLANPGIEVCSHTHSYRTVTRAVALDIPAIVLIRDPEQVVASSLQYQDGVPPSLVIKQYRKFHQHVARIPPDRLVLGDYEEVIRDFGSIIARCNAVLGTGFDPYQPSPESEAKIRDVLRVWEGGAIPDALREARSSLPHSARKDAASRILTSLMPSERDALAIAKAEYQNLRTRFISASPLNGTAG
jgi:hypothetical protein